MSFDTRALRPYAPFAVLVVTVALGWMVFIRPVSADRSRAAAQLQRLRQREMVLRHELGEAAPRGVDVDPALAFERRVASNDASPAVLEQLAHLVTAARARNLLIETVEPGQASTAPASTARDSALQRDPRFALFDVPVSQVPIRIAFDADYASVGRFLWAFRNLPTAVEIRALSVGLPPPDPGDENGSARADVLRVSLTLNAYSRSGPAVMQASNTLGNGTAR
jgi:hypothetical protein